MLCVHATSIMRVVASKIQHIRLTKVNKSSLGMLLHHVDYDLGYLVNRLKD